MIDIKNLQKTIGKQKIINDLSLNVPRGTVFGFLGPNGAGKTTTMKILVGINKADSGTIMIAGMSPTNAKERQHIGFMPEEPHFYDQLSGYEFMEFSRELFSKTSSDINELLKKTGIFDARHKKIKNYSKGMKQRLGFAQALINDPDYIFLDEPLEGLDPIGRREIKVMLAALKKEGKTIFFNSHILSDVENICDTIGIINKGHLIYTGPVRDFCKDKDLEERFVEVITQNK